MKKITVPLHDYVGDFAENKDEAKKIRVNIIIPHLRAGDEVIFDFQGISGATQSFVHALLSKPIRMFQDVAYDNLCYINANRSTKEIISIVYRYMQESLSSGELS